ncbi:MAG: hypothetical protein K1X67_19400 [Fimbriimonadaceae bacterium]|nr:hypothetical protein [Fimbriimonadaceae bacterium]
MKKLNILFVVGAATLAAQSPAGLLFSFESGTEGWYNPTWSTGDLVFAQGTTGATHGCYSLKVTMPFISGAGDQFRWIVADNNNTGLPLDLMAMIQGAPKMYVDMTIPADENAWPTANPPIWWFNGKFILNDGTGSWREAPQVDFPRAPGTYRVEWDISGISGGVDLNVAFHRIGFSVNHTPDVARTFYLDNFRVGSNVQGTLALPDWTASPAGVTAWVDVYASGGSTPLESASVTLGACGEFSMPCTLPAGTYDVSVKGSHWLARRVNGVTFDEAGANGLTASNLNGDCDGDNEVGIGDYAQLSASYGLSLGDTGYDAAADLNGDEAVDIADYAILSSNYGETGD